jgi:hypothetical protein
MRNFVFLFVFFIITVSCNSQSKKTDFIYKKVNKKLIYRVNLDKEVNQIKFVDLKSYLPVNYVQNGTVDYTSYIQKGINENKFVRLPNFPILISEKGLTLKSNSVIYFNQKSKLILAVNSLPKYQILDLKNIENVKIYNPRLVGDRIKHKGTTGEWGMGINIISSSNISIYNPEITNCWGDGIYVSGISTKESESIFIKGGLLDNNRRNGISIISGKNINISNIYISNTYGTLPMAGIDIEPNENGNTLERINLNKITTFNNGDAGIAVILLNMIGKRQHVVDVNIDSHKDTYSKYALIMGGSKTGYKYPDDIKPLGGAVNIRNSQWNDNSGKVSIAADFTYTAKYKFSNLKIKTAGKEDIKETESKTKKIREQGFIVN